MWPSNFLTEESISKKTSTVCIIWVFITQGHQNLNMPTEASKEARSKELQAKARVNLTAMPKLAYQLLTQNIVSFSVHVK